jgi:hypothetical protein
MEFLPRSPRSTSHLGHPREAVDIRVPRGTAILCGRSGCCLAPVDQDPGPSGA